VELNTDDARRLGVRDGERIRLKARTGTTVAAARVTPEVKAGTIFVPLFCPQGGARDWWQRGDTGCGAGAGGKGGGMKARVLATVTTF
jgi:anaerobic selenocysteine-containing dehydrogenase